MQKIIKIFVIVILIYSIFTYLYKGIFQPRSGRKTDFESYYTASIALKNNINPYDRKKMLDIAVKHYSHHIDFHGNYKVNYYVYPPLFAQLITPLTYFKIGTARIIWSCLINFIFFCITLIFIYKKVWREYEYS